MTMADLLREFIRSKKINHTKASTLEDYERSISAFLDEFGDDISRQTVRDWTEQLQDAGYADSTVSKYLRALRVFINWAAEEGKIKRFKVDIPKIRDKQKREALTREEVEQVDKWLHKTYPTGYGGKGTIVDTNLQMHLRFWFPLETACRISECVNATFEDIDWDSMSIYIPAGKTDVSDHVNLDTLWGHLPVLLKSVPDKTGYILRTNQDRTYDNEYRPKGSQLTYQGHRTFMRRLRKGTNIDVHITPHTLRRTHATIAANEGIPVPTLASQLRHKSWEMLQKHYYKDKVDQRAQVYKRQRQNGD